jgi:hypothetical protein
MPEENKSYANHPVRRGKAEGLRDPITGHYLPGNLPPGAGKMITKENSRELLKLRWDRYRKAKQEGIARAVERHVAEGTLPAVGEENRTEVALGILVEHAVDVYMKADSGRDLGGLLERIERSAGTLPAEEKAASVTPLHDALELDEARVIINIAQMNIGEVYGKEEVPEEEVIDGTIIDQL